MNRNVRILIAAPPKTGNSWLKCLLSSIYDLRRLKGTETPETRGIDAFRHWLTRGAFPDNTIYHQHFDYSPEFVDLTRQHSVQIATILRNPYDQFVSLYHWVQSRADKAAELMQQKPRSSDVMIGKPIDHPDTVAYLADGYGDDLRKGIGWLQSGHSAVVRYEALHVDPVAELTAATRYLAPASQESIARAINGCDVQNLRQSRGAIKPRVRSGTVGDWQNHLTDEHLAIVRDHHADLVKELGYEVIGTTS